MAAITHGHLPRPAPEFYGGRAMVHWVLAIDQRKAGWLNESFHLHWREIMLHALVRYRLLCPVYCLMPDHAHVVWMGVAENSDQRDALKFFRTQTTPFLGSFTWQRQPFDHVLRDHERAHGAFMKVCRYVLENPVRKELVARPRDYAFSGAMVPGYPTLGPRAEGFWELFWKIYNSPR